MSEAKPIGAGDRVSHSYQHVPGYSPPIHAPICRPSSFAYTTEQLLWKHQPRAIDQQRGRALSWNRPCPKCFPATTPNNASPALSNASSLTSSANTT